MDYRYPKRETHNLARFISVMKTQQLSWRSSHPYILVDRFEDVTPPERVHANMKCDRNITVYGYLRGSNMKRGTKVFLHWFCIVLIIYEVLPTPTLPSCMVIFLLISLKIHGYQNRYGCPDQIVKISKYLPYWITRTCAIKIIEKDER